MKALLLLLILAAPASAEKAGLQAETAWWRGKLVVLSVDEGTATRSAGLKHGDRIISIDGKPVKSAKDARRLVGPIGVELVMLAAGPKEKPRTVSIFREARSTRPVAAQDLEEIDKGVDAGDAASLYALGMVEQTPHGPRTDSKSSVAHLKESADQGFVLAMYRLARARLSGYGGVKDEKEAAELARKAADAGNPDSMLLLWKMTLNGYGVEADKTAAGVWLHKAADAGNVDAACALAAAPNEPESFQWASKIASTECGMLALARHYSEGIGVEQDLVKAYEYAARLGSEGSRAGEVLARELEKKMPAEDLAVIKNTLREQGIETFELDPITRKNMRALEKAGGIEPTDEVKEGDVPNGGETLKDPGSSNAYQKGGW